MIYIYIYLSVISVDIVTDVMICYNLTKDQVGARAKGFELFPHRCHSSIYELAVI